MRINVVVDLALKRGLFVSASTEIVGAVRVLIVFPACIQILVLALIVVLENLPLQVDLLGWVASSRITRIIVLLIHLIDLLELILALLACILLQLHALIDIFGVGFNHTDHHV